MACFWTNLQETIATCGDAIVERVLMPSYATTEWVVLDAKVDSVGNVHLLSTEWGGGPLHHTVRYAASGEWSDPSSVGGISTNYGVSKDLVITSPDDLLFMKSGWTGYPATTAYISTDGGVSWSGATAYTPVSGDALFVRTTKAPSGKLFSVALVQETNYSNPANLSMLQSASSTDDGATWSIDGTVTSRPSYFDVGLYHIGSYVVHAFDDNNLVVLAALEPGITSGETTDLYAIFSSDGGATWGAEVFVNDLVYAVLGKWNASPPLRIVGDTEKAYFSFFEGTVIELYKITPGTVTKIGEYPWEVAPSVSNQSVIVPGIERLHVVVPDGWPAYIDAIGEYEQVFSGFLGVSDYIQYPPRQLTAEYTDDVQFLNYFAAMKGSGNRFIILATGYRQSDGITSPYYIEYQE